jgi:histidinol-phosphate aminotransferase
VSGPGNVLDSVERYEPDRRPVEIDLSDNTNLWGSQPDAVRALQAAESGLARYPSTYGDLLREAVGRRYGLRVSHVTTGCGSDDVLDSAFRALAGAGGRLVYMEPTFSMIPGLARVNALDAIPIPWDPRIGAPSVESLLEPRPDVVYLCSPNNPTGAALDRSWLEALLTLSAETGTSVILDEAYVDFGGESLISEAPGRKGLLVVRTLSKAYGLAGLRAGYGVGSEDLILSVDKSRGPYKLSALADQAAAAALEDASGWVEQRVAEVVDLRARLAEALVDLGFAPFASEANFVLVPVQPDPLKVAEALRGHGIAVRPFRIAQDEGAIRVTVAPWPMLVRFLEALATEVRP